MRNDWWIYLVPFSVEILDVRLPRQLLEFLYRADTNNLREHIYIYQIMEMNKL